MYPEEIGGGVEPSVNVLAKLAGGGRALELGIGTGRVALPLAERGVTVQRDRRVAGSWSTGCAPSPAVTPYRSPSATSPSFRSTADYELIFVVCNTLFGLATQDAQVQCFVQRVAEHLAAGGTFLIEAFVPDPARFVGGRNLSVSGIEPDLATLDVARHDAANQRVYSQHLLLTEAGTRLYPVQLRYAWPSELDLMARLAGLRLRDRWSGWDGAPFTAASWQPHLRLRTRPGSIRVTARAGWRRQPGLAGE